MKPTPTSKPKLWRDDDPNVYTNAYLFKQLHQKFIDKKVTHTAAVIMKDLWQNHALFWYLATAPYLEIGLHGWEHKNYGELDYYHCLKDITKSLEYWQENSTRMTGQAKEIKIFFSPWNKDGTGIRQACETAGLAFCNVRKGEWNGYEVKSFHWWNCMDDNYEIIISP